jgi:hypothetical protein
MFSPEMLNITEDFIVNVRNLHFEAGTGKALPINDLPPALRKCWSGITGEIWAEMDLHVKINKKLKEKFPIPDANTMRQTDYLIRRVQSSIKEYFFLNAKIPLQPDEIIEGLEREIKKTFDRCLKRLTETQKQDEQLHEWLNAYISAGSESEKAEFMSNIAKTFRDVTDRHIKWATPGQRLQDEELEGRRIIFNDSLKEIALEYVEKYRDLEDLPSLSAYIVNKLFAKASEIRTNFFAEINMAQPQKDWLPQNTQNPEEIFFTEPTLLKMLELSFNMKPDEVYNMIIQLVSNPEKPPEEAKRQFENFMEYKTRSGFSLHLRLYALYLRDYKRESCENICRELSEPPFNLKNFVPSEQAITNLATNLDRLRDKIKEKLDEKGRNKYWEERVKIGKKGSGINEQRK